ncbi:GIY-YIG nuclease family protein [Flammeovirga kamogawensis]|uniref:GIY-YIG nuclease family protein n=1 Tax=Flammeovirga kamogawensis TaxID=373891 RepID=A0ABX8H1A1_9BACT|nr:GIY-YIG nuclease family protein [Flammeovirga kamogawensis]MBB6462186.1 seryl-tRNA synthetase [Flammeovirga kamogawensis]QWG09413.1 GIY-YIG nuclease family protein [Flammeovirga kamogawensis]TRX64931.1 hypothetical protein EO216_20575 [Flammeovirga kamogawensis]
MQEQFFYAVATIFALVFVLLIPVMFLIRGKKIKKQNELLSVKSNSDDKFNELQKKNDELLNELEIQKNEYNSKLNDLERELVVKGDNLTALANRLINDYVDFLSTKVTSSNYVEVKHQLEEIFEFCEVHSFKDEEGKAKSKKDLKHRFEELVRKEIQVQEQTRLQNQMHDEKVMQGKVKQELERLKLEKENLSEALNTAVQEANEKQVELLQLKLNRVEENIERATSQSKNTTSGFVYILSNFGAFGEDVFKIGMTQDENPNRLINEFGNATVPYPFDIHAMIPSDNAAVLLETLHSQLNKYRVNRVDLEKNFFSVSIQNIIDIVEEVEGKVTFTKDPEALEYFRSMETTAEELNYLSKIKK